MAIDRMKKVTVLCPLDAAERLNRIVHDMGIVELVDAQPFLGDTANVVAAPEVTTSQYDVAINKIHLILSLIDEFAPEKKSFVEGLTPLPLIIEAGEIEKALAQFDLDAVHQAALDADESRKKAQRRMAEIRTQIESLMPLEDVPFRVSDLRSPVRTRLIFGTVPAKALAALDARPEIAEVLAWARVESGPTVRADHSGTAKKSANGDQVRIVVACLPENEETARRLLATENFKEVPLPELHGKVRDRVRELQGDFAECESQLAAVRDEAVALARHRRTLQVLGAYWQDQRRVASAHGLAAAGRWVHVFTGYLRERDVAYFERTLNESIPQAEATIEDPAAGENVPVSITSPKLVKPVQMLVNLFGLPPYNSFDPSPFIIGTFLLFFGICFGDVGYGLMLTALGAYLAHKTKAYEGVYGFARLLLLAGISTTIFGVLLGSWLGDIYDPKYLGENNFLLQIKERAMILDPLNDPVTMLLVALGIGVVNQFYGITLKMYGAARAGDWVTAICDGLLWLVALPGMIVMVSGMFVQVPGPLFTVGLSMFAIGAIGLVLTQGRNETGVVSKGVTGLVSLYGIVGSYGCTAFLGDVLSYCRLLALALTTSIVALTVNMIAGLLWDVPAVGPVLFVVVLVLGHLFNFSISLLGAFVHAMRLIFVEFFGRFYEGGAKPFTPYGFDSPSYVLKRPLNSNM